jgi:hypothetical protein
MRKLPYREGTWFAVPLRRDNGFGVGVVARAAPKGRIILAYLFGPKRTTVPTLTQVKGLNAGGAVLSIRVSDLGLIRGTWPIIGQARSWQRAEWPMPVFIRREGGIAWLVHYAADDPSRRVAEEPALPQTTVFQEDGLDGVGSAEIYMTKVLTEARQ